jgi:hypothetical protein
MSERSLFTGASLHLNGSVGNFDGGLWGPDWRLQLGFVSEKQKMGQLNYLEQDLKVFDIMETS